MMGRKGEEGNKIIQLTRKGKTSNIHGDVSESDPGNNQTISASSSKSGASIKTLLERGLPTDKVKMYPSDNLQRLGKNITYF